ncbi:MAG: hypothetical protein IJ678_00100 [Kiritimatiellae bacterium]|nr:hypothetical protein [Kiritimatiellia bacterium]MBR1835975.1 hypothetical protein [Kiritimatiellia bacterium]
MPANAAVTLDLKANTASAIRGVETLHKQLQTLQVQARASADAWSNLKTSQKFKVGTGVAAASLDVVTALSPEIGQGNKYGKLLSSAAQGAQRLGMMLAPLGPTAIAVGAAVGGMTSAVKSFAESSREARKAVEEETRAKKAAERSGTRSLIDARTEHELALRGASPEERAKMQHDARRRLDEAQYRLDRGASISEKDVFDALNWLGDGPLARRLFAAHAKQNDGKLSPAMEMLRDVFKRDNAEKGLSSVIRGSAWRRNLEAVEKADRRADDLETKSLDGYYVPGARRRYAQQAKAAREAAKAASRELDALESPYQAVLDNTPRHEAASREAFRRGTGFDSALDALYEQSLRKPEKADEAPRSPLASAFAPAPADAFSAVGLGYVGAGDKSAEMVDLLKRIAESTETTSRKSQTAILAQ